jgi:tRNA pseudouridine55 synthase
MANLTQLKMLEDLDGVLLVDKPAGIAFSTVVKTVKRKFGLVKVGHGGSLDAMATGLLVILLGDANKFASDVMGADRSWSGSLRFGETTDTGDRYGRPVPLPARVMQPSEAKGDLFQVEPRFCSVRREGSAEYEVADTGEHTQFLAHVYRFDVAEHDAERGTSDFTLVASKGVIVRALAQDLGATLVSLRRTKVGKLSVDDAVAFDRLLETEPKDFPALVQPISKALSR